ncbi:hypothetical protein AHAS_Ahas19G0220400 [Arachis hypogaea]
MEKDTQEKSHSTKAEKCKEEKPMEPPMQEALNEEITPTTTQPPKLGLKEVKAINKSTEKRIVTKLQRTTFKRRESFNLLEEKVHHHGQRKDMEPNNNDDTDETNRLQEVVLFSD